MCSTSELVPIPPHLLNDRFDETHPEYGIDAQGRKCFVIDACIAPVMRLLFDAGIVTTGCCCGHGSGRGVVSLAAAEYDTPVVEPPACTHEGAPRATVCAHCWAAVD